MQEESSIKDRLVGCGIVGSSKAMQDVYRRVLRAAATSANIVIYGESGTGKELVGRAIHDLSDRCRNEFVSVNCAAIPEDYIEAEFFGYRRGAFAGALTDKAGYLAVAKGGTLFLDEVEQIGLKMQAKLLRVIEGEGFVPVGGHKTKEADVRFVFATNRNLTELVDKSAMRPDFFFTIHVIPIYLPSLRDRKEDIPILMEYFLKENGVSPKEIPLIKKEILDTLVDYDWPGNVRELQNVLKRYVSLGSIGLPARSTENRVRQAGISTQQLDPEIMDIHTAVRNFEKSLIAKALDENRWHRTKVASILGINRRTLFKKMQYHGLSKPRNDRD